MGFQQWQQYLSPPTHSEIRKYLVQIFSFLLLSLIKMPLERRAVWKTVPLCKHTKVFSVDFSQLDTAISVNLGSFTSLSLFVMGRINWMQSHGLIAQRQAPHNLGKFSLGTHEKLVFTRPVILTYFHKFSLMSCFHCVLFSSY